MKNIKKNALIDKNNKIKPLELNKKKILKNNEFIKN